MPYWPQVGQAPIVLPRLEPELLLTVRQQQFQKCF
jgi:hypothetical protein